MAVSCLSLAGSVAHGQVIADSAVVTVDDSPAAEQLFQEAVAQAAENPTRTARLAMQLLEEYPDRLLAGDSGDGDLFLPVRSEVIRLLGSRESLVNAWRLEATPSANDLLVGAPARKTFDRRPLTDPGFEAGLRLIQERMESGDFAGALHISEEVESWPQSRSQRLRRLVLAAMSAGLEARQKTGVDQMEWQDLSTGILDEVSSEDAALADRVRSILETFRIDSLETGFSSMERSDSMIEDFLEEVWTPIWDDDLSDSLYYRRFFDPVNGQPSSRSRADRALVEASNMTSIPVVVGGVVLVNEGMRLRAWDRLTGRERWFKDHGIIRGMRQSGNPGDLGEIVVEGNAAVTVVGHAFGNGREGSGEIIRFDPETGIERWRVRPSRLIVDENLDDAFVSGPPLIVSGQVIVPLRKVNSRQETIEFLVGLNLDTGKPVWFRPIVSSGGVRMGGSRGFSRLKKMNGDVIFVSAVGAVTRLDAATGRPRWLRRFKVPLRAQRTNANPWEIGEPAILDRGIAFISPTMNEWVLLDAETGGFLESHPMGPGTIIGNARYFLAVPAKDDRPEYLLAVGRDLVAIDPRNPQERLWSFGDKNRDEITNRPGSSDRNGIRGRVQLLDNGVGVPFADAMGVVDLDTGQLRRIFMVPDGGNPLLVSGQFFVAGDRRLNSYMPVAKAVEALRERLVDEPANIEQALGLLDLARRTGDTDLAMEASELAVQALDANDDPSVRSDVLIRLLSVIDEDVLGIVEAERVHKLASRIAVTPEEQVRRLLCLGDWAERQGRTREGVEAWREILQDTAFLNVEALESNEVVIPSSVAAERRIRLARSKDPAIAEWLDREASREVEAALANRATAEMLLEIARSAPGSSASGRAVRRAVEIFRDEGRTLEAIGTAFKAVTLLEGAELRDILMTAAEVAQADGRSSLARSLREVGGISVPKDNQQIVSGWPLLAAKDRLLPVVGRETEPESLSRIDGHLVNRRPSAELDAPLDSFMVVNDGNLEKRRSDDLSIVWYMPVSDSSLQVIRHTPDILLWEFPGKSSPILTALDPATGAIRWKQDRIEDLLPQDGKVGTTPEGTRPDRSPFLPWRIEPVPTDHGIALVRANGDVAMLAPDGRSSSWQATGLLERVYGSFWDGALLHLWGIGRATEENDGTLMNGELVSIDPVNGRRVSQVRLEGVQPSWALALDDGMVAVGTSRGIRLVDPFEVPGLSSRGWHRQGPQVRDTRLAWGGDQHLVVVDGAGVPLAFDASTGMKRADRWQMPPDPGWQPGGFLGRVDLGEIQLLRYSDRLLSYDQSGRLLGIDSIADGNLDRSDWQVVPARDLVLLISRHQRTGHYLYRVHRLSPNMGLRIEGRPFDLLPPERSYESVRAIDGWLILGARNRIDAIPLAGQGQ